MKSLGMFPGRSLQLSVIQRFLKLTPWGWSWWAVKVHSLLEFFGFHRLSLSLEHLCQPASEMTWHVVPVFFVRKIVSICGSLCSSVPFQHRMMGFGRNIQESTSRSGNVFQALPHDKWCHVSNMEIKEKEICWCAKAANEGCPRCLLM